MSALERPDAPVRRKRVELTSLPHPQRSHSWFRGSFPLTILALLAVGMVGHLGLQTAIQNQAFELGALQAQADRLGAQEAILHATLDKQSTPQQLAYTAAGLGMVANPYSTYLVLPTGEILGTHEAVRGNELPIISAAPQIIPTSPEVQLDETPTEDTPVEAAAEAVRAEPDQGGVPEEGTQQ